jgi:hypothetical protein
MARYTDEERERARLKFAAAVKSGRSLKEAAEAAGISAGSYRAWNRSGGVDTRGGWSYEKAAGAAARFTKSTRGASGGQGSGRRKPASAVKK